MAELFLRNVPSKFEKKPQQLRKTDWIGEEPFLSFFTLLHYYSIRRVYQVHGTADRQSIHKKFLTPKEKTSALIHGRWG